MNPKLKQKLMYTSVGYVLLMGNVVALAFNHPSIGLGLAVLSGYYFLKSLLIRPERK
jgi:hypothetical protein